jgi:hypothetical protein
MKDGWSLLVLRHQRLTRKSVPHWCVCWGLLFLVGCSSNEPSSTVMDWLSFHAADSSHERYLNVDIDGRYESALKEQHLTRSGSLSDAQRTELGSFVSEERFDLYAQEALADCEAATADVWTVAWREQIGEKLQVRTGCWVRTEVENADTQAFLDEMSELQLALAK